MRLRPANRRFRACRKSGSGSFPALEKPWTPRQARAFTLIEIMVVVGIIGLIMTAGIPSLYQLMRRDGYQKGVSDLLDVCNNARARAVLQDTTTAIVFHPHERRCDLEGGAKASIISTAGGTGLTAQFPDTVSLEMLDVNLREYKDAEIARVRFFPNGTSDEMTVIVRGDNNEWRKISLEITTGMVSVTDKIQ